MANSGSGDDTTISDFVGVASPRSRICTAETLGISFIKDYGKTVLITIQGKEGSMEKTVAVQCFNGIRYISIKDCLSRHCWVVVPKLFDNISVEELSNKGFTLVCEGKQQVFISGPGFLKNLDIFYQRGGGYALAETPIGNFKVLLPDAWLKSQIKRYSEKMETA